MKKYLSSNPTFSDAINIVEPTDPAHADNVNAAPKQLLENTVHNKQRLDDLKNKILNTMEEIEANTDTENYVGALALKELSADLKNILEQISSNLGAYIYIPFNGTTAITGEETRITNLPNTNFTPGRYIIFAKTHIKEVAVYSALFGMLTFNEACGCGFYVFANTETWNIELRVTQYSGHEVVFDNAYGSGLHIVKLAAL